MEKALISSGEPFTAQVANSTGELAKAQSQVGPVNHFEGAQVNERATLGLGLGRGG